jgi:hypothetical protein
VEAAAGCRPGDDDEERRDLTSGDPLGGSGTSGAESAFGGELPSSAESAFGREPDGGEQTGGWAPPGGTPERGAPASGEQPGGWAPPGGASESGTPAGGGWQAPQQGQWAPLPHTTVPSTNGKATAALVLGIVGLIFCPVVASIPAIILGYQGRNEIDASQGRQTNRGIATAGIVTGWIGVVFGVVLIALVLLGMAVGGVTTDDSVDSEPAGVPSVLLARALLAIPGL